MLATPTTGRLPQLLDQYRAVTTQRQDSRLIVLAWLTYHSTALEGSALTWTQTRTLLQSGQPQPTVPMIDQWQVLDHYQALELTLTMASQHDPLNRIALQEIAATLMHHSSAPSYSLLTQINTGKGELRVDNAGVGNRVLVAAPKLPAALDELLKRINTRISQLTTPRQVYELSFQAHYDLLTLHPFGAGNGPMARLLMNYIQRYHQLPLSVVYDDHRWAYRTVLKACWQQDKAVPLTGFLHNQLLRLLAEGPPQLMDKGESSAEG